jgi:aspartyl-tRNA(Asn)/glutamyl-tRNA(Gln) amidotransferase subunit A
VLLARYRFGKEGSSRRLPADPWEKDGPIAATIRRQLGPITGKTHMVEFAFGGTGLNSHYGAPGELA